MKYFVFLSFLFLPIILFSQKHDYVWVVGDSNDDWPNHGGSVMDFNTDTLTYYAQFRNMNFREVNTSISDSIGNLLFYCNGCDIAGADDSIIENGDNINAGYAHEIFCDSLEWRKTYFSGFHSILTLPVPDRPNVYRIFHERSYLSPNWQDGHIEALLWTEVDMNQNNGKGKVIFKNMPIIEDTLSLGQLNAVKHANGKDWWITVPRRFTNTYYTFRFTKDGIIDTLVQSIGEPLTAQWEGREQSHFAPDGSFLFRYRKAGKGQIRYFDRNTGLFTDYKSFDINYDTTVFNGSCGISPNSRFLYVAHDMRVYQFDIQADDISASQTTVGWWDGFKDPVGITFNHMQLAPNCKIYIMGGGDTKYFHVIHNPDEKGLACNLEMRGVVLPTPKGASMPFPPNYRLGPIDNPGLPCTSSVSASTPTMLPALSVFPNPATDFVTIIANRVLPEGSRWRLYDLHGRIMRDISVSHLGDARQVVEVAGLGNGLYFWELRGGDGRLVRSGKIVKN